MMFEVCLNRQRLLQRSLVIGVEVAMQNDSAIRVSKLLPHRTVGVDQCYRPELGALLPSSCDLQAGQFGRSRNARHSFFPILDSRPADAELLSCLLLRVPERFSPL